MWLLLNSENCLSLCCSQFQWKSFSKHFFGLIYLETQTSCGLFYAAFFGWRGRHCLSIFLCIYLVSNSFVTNECIFKSNPTTPPMWPRRQLEDLFSKLLHDQLKSHMIVSQNGLRGTKFSQHCVWVHRRAMGNTMQFHEMLCRSLYSADIILPLVNDHRPLYIYRSNLHSFTTVTVVQWL